MLQRKCVFDSGSDGIGLVVDMPLAVEPSWRTETSRPVTDGSWAEPGLEALPRALNLNARIAMAASTLGDVLLGAMLADGSDPVSPAMRDPMHLPMWIKGSEG